jgi:hypothetical protein
VCTVTAHQKVAKTLNLMPQRTIDLDESNQLIKLLKMGFSGRKNSRVYRWKKQLISTYSFAPLAVHGVGG